MSLIPPQSPRGLSVRETLPEATLLGDDVRVQSCTSDPTAVRPGDLFVVLREDRLTAHDQARIAAQRGASMIISEQLLPTPGAPQATVEDCWEAYGRLCHALRGDPCRSLPTIGVAGSYGKSSVAALLRSIFATAGNDIAYSTTHGWSDGCVRCDLPLAAGSPAPIASWLASSFANGCVAAISEISETELRGRSTAGLELDALCITNMTCDLRHGAASVAFQRSAYERLWDKLKPEGLAILNIDDPAVARELATFDGPALTFSLEKPAEVRGAVVERFPFEQTMIVTVDNDSVAVRTSVPGDAHARNCLAAIATALGYGIDLMTAARGVEAVTRLPGVLEPVHCGQSFAVYRDAGHSPESIRAAISAARDGCEGKVIAVLTPAGAGVANDTGNEQVAASLADRVITSVDYTDAQETACQVTRVEDRFAAVTVALALAEAGDAVVVTGCDVSPVTEADDPAAADVVRRLIERRRQAEAAAPQY